MEDNPNGRCCSLRTAGMCGNWRRGFQCKKERLYRRIKEEEVITAPRSLFQNPFVERLVGSIRRECLDRVIILNEEHLRRILREYFDYYHKVRSSPPLESVDCIIVIGALHKLGEPSLLAEFESNELRSCPLRWDPTFPLQNGITAGRATSPPTKEETEVGATKKGGSMRKTGFLR